MTSTLTDEFMFDTEFIEPDEPEVESIDPELADVPGDFIEEVKETPRAKRYRLKTKHGLNFLMRILAGSEKTVPDAAAIIMHGPAVAKAVGHLCDTDDRARKFVDFVTDDGIDNPYILAAF